MAAIEVKSFQSPDDVRPFEGKGHADVVSVGGRSVARGTYEPGWRWSQNVKPVVKTESCEISHLGYVISGRLRITMDDGSQGEIGPGDVFAIPSGHDGEVVGDEPCVMLDFGDVGDYAKPG